MRVNLRRSRKDETLPDGLAERLQRTLVPVEPSAAFVANLRARLEEMHTQQMRGASLRRGVFQRTPPLATRFGVILSLVALVAFGVQLVGSVIMIVLLLLGRRRRAAAPA